MTSLKFWAAHIGLGMILILLAFGFQEVWVQMALLNGQRPDKGQRAHVLRKIEHTRDGHLARRVELDIEGVIHPIDIPVDMGESWWANLVEGRGYRVFLDSKDGVEHLRAYRRAEIPPMGAIHQTADCGLCTRHGEIKDIGEIHEQANLTILGFCGLGMMSFPFLPLIVLCWHKLTNTRPAVAGREG